MAKQQADESSDFDLGFSPEEFEKLQPDQGVGFKRIHYGDFTFEIVGTRAQTSKGKTPHNMLVVTSRVVSAYDDAAKSEIGSEITTYYAGSPQSPDYMKKRLKALCVAANVNPSKQGGLKGSSFIGKKYDASIVWELNQGDKLDDFGRPKLYVNDRLKGERKVGGERPQGLNPKVESAKAEQFLAGGAAPDAAAETPPWVAPTETPAEEPATGGFIDESEVDGLGFAYRAAYKLGDEAAKETLIGAGIDPEGPINADMIEDPALKKAYLDAFAPKPEAKKGLPPLNGAKKGVRAPAQARQ